MRLHKLYFVSKVDQAEEEKTPNGCEGGRGHTQVSVTQRRKRQKRKKLPMAVKADEVYKVPPMRRKTLWKNPGRTDSSALTGNWPRRENSDKKQKKQTNKQKKTNKQNNNNNNKTHKKLSLKVGRYKPSWQGENRVPTRLSIMWPCR